MQRFSLCRGRDKERKKRGYTPKLSFTHWSREVRKKAHPLELKQILLPISCSVSVPKVTRKCELFSVASTFPLSCKSRRERPLASGLTFTTWQGARALVMELITKALQMTNTAAAQASAMMNNPLAEFQLIYFAKSRSQEELLCICWHCTRWKLEDTGRWLEELAVDASDFLQFPIAPSPGSSWDGEELCSWS